MLRHARPGGLALGEPRGITGADADHHEARCDADHPGRSPHLRDHHHRRHRRALKSQGWTYQQQEFKIGSADVPGGIWCLWADFKAASDQGQTYGWMPMGAADARNAQARLQADGWVRSNEGSTVFYTEDPDYAIAKDDQGFGMTYEFGDGWVKFADTKQGLLLINWGQ